VVAVTAAVVSSLRQTAARRQRLALMGFSPVAHPDPELSERLSALSRRHGGGRVRVRNVLRKDADGYQLYILDATTQRGESASDTQETVVLVSPRLRLPGFSLFPKVEAGGFLAETANRVMVTLLGRMMPAIEMPEHPEFARRYTLFGTDEAGVRAAFSDDILAHLSEAPGLVVEAGGDTLTLARLPMPGKAAKTALPPLEESLREAAVLFDLLRAG